METQEQHVEISENIAETEIINSDADDLNNKEHVHFSSNVSQDEIQRADTERNDNADVNNNRNWNVRLMFGAVFCFKFLGLINYISDVGSDIGNGYQYLGTQAKWPRLADNSGYNYTEELCENWESYQHVIMGSLTLIIVFIPSALGALFLGKSSCQQTH